MSKQIEMSPEEAAKYLGVSRRTLERYVQDRRITKQEEFAPRRVFFYISDLDALKEGHPIVRPVTRLPMMIENFDRYVEDELGLKSISRFVESPKVTPVSERIADLMGIPTGTLVIYRFLRQGVIGDDRVVYWRLSENYYNIDVYGEDMLAGSFSKDPQFDTLQTLKERNGKVPVESRLTTIARLPNAREQKLLNISRGAPILEVTGTNYAEDETVVFVNQRYCVGDLVEMTVNVDLPFWRKGEVNAAIIRQ